MRSFFFGFFALAMLASCSPNIPHASEPILVRPVDLVRGYRDARQTADDSYFGQTVMMPVADAIARQNELHWHIGAADHPAVIVFQFNDPPKQPTGLIWIRGICRGRIPDGGHRELPDYTFYVLIVECQIVSPPKKPDIVARFDP